MPGLTLTGFETLTLGEIRDAINTRWRSEFGASMDVSDRSPDGQVIGIFSERVALLWEVLEAIVASLDPDKATGVLLQAICALTGTEKRPASFSTATLTLTGTPTTLVSADQLISTASTGKQFTTLDDVTITAVDEWVTLTAYVVVDRVTNDGNVYVCITAGTSGATGPTDTIDDETDGTAHWRFVGPGTGAVDVAARATEAGSIVAVSGDLTQRDTFVGGWDGVVNLLDASVGREAMTDAELRVLREAELAQPGTSTKRAIRAALLEVTGVTAATVFSNVTDVTDGDGVPPHSVEALVQGGADQDIWDTLLDNVADGIRTYGTETGTAIDDEGTAQDMAFSRPTDLPIYVRVALEVDASEFPADGEAQVQAAIAALGTGRATGLDVRAPKVGAAAEAVAGVLGATEVRIYTDVIAAGAAWASSTAYSATVGARSVVTNQERAYICITSGTSAGSGGPTGTGTDITDGTAHWRFLGATIPIALRELAAFDTSRVTVVATEVTP